MINAGIPDSVCADRLYKGLQPLWGRQIPYTMMKFACFENTVEALYKYVVPKPKAQCSKNEQLGVSFVAGYIAGIFCAVVSQPADNLVSKLNSQPGATAGSELPLLHLYNPQCSISWLSELLCPKASSRGAFARLAGPFRNKMADVKVMYEDGMNALSCI